MNGCLRQNQVAFWCIAASAAKKMVLAQFKKDVDNLQALAQKGEAYESVGNENKLTIETNKPPRKTQQMMEKYARWILSHRRIVLTVVMLLTLALAYLASGVKLLLTQMHLRLKGILISPRPS